MQIVSADRFTVVSDKLRQDHRFVFVADLHIGSSQSMQTVKNTIRKIDEENADFVLLGGDIVDEYTEITIHNRPAILSADLILHRMN